MGNTRRRWTTLIVGIGWLIGLVGIAQSIGARPQDRNDHSTDLARIADAYLEGVLAQQPFWIYFGLAHIAPNPDHAAFPDTSPEAWAALESLEDDLSAKLDDIDPGAFASRADWVTYRVLKERLEANRELRVCRQHLWSLNHIEGWQAIIATVAAAQPVDTAHARAAAIAWWSKLSGFIDRDIENLREGLRLGYSAPKSVVRRVMAQVDGLIAAPGGKSPLMAFAVKAEGEEAFRQETRELYETDVLPALKKFRLFLQDEYLNAAREEIAISVLPRGRDCYEAKLRFYQTITVGADVTYARGMEAVAANRAGIVSRGEALFGESNIAAILEAVNARADNRFQAESEVLDYSRRLMPTLRDRIAPFFHHLPEQDVTVRPYPDHLRGTGLPSRYRAVPDKTRPAIYLINLDGWETQTQGGSEVVAAHEGWPGHHLQIGLSYDIEGLHPVTLLVRSEAFAEGWARYAEALAEEAGVYESGMGEIMRRAWPARGMVLDPGVHIFGWTDEKAVDFIKEAALVDDARAFAMLDRIAVLPGQLTAYDTGGLEIFALRRVAEDHLGDRFDIRDFHQRVLENGALPLAALRDHIEAWLDDAED